MMGPRSATDPRPPVFREREVPTPPAAGPRVGPSRRLPWLIAIAALGLGFLIVNDHVLPALRGERGSAEPSAGVEVNGVRDDEVAPEAVGELPPGESTSPVLSGDSARRALREYEREMRTRTTRPHPERGTPPSL